MPRKAKGDNPYLPTIGDSKEVLYPVIHCECNSAWIQQLPYAPTQFNSTPGIAVHFVDEPAEPREGGYNYRCLMADHYFVQVASRMLLTEQEGRNDSTPGMSPLSELSAREQKRERILLLGGV